MDNEAAVPLSLHVGQLDGRLTSLEARADRFETTVSDNLHSINAKLDSLASALSVKTGERAGVGSVFKVVATIAAMLSGWLAALGHIHFS
jgi:hypothetical protein